MIWFGLTVMYSARYPGTHSNEMLFTPSILDRFSILSRQKIRNFCLFLVYGAERAIGLYMVPVNPNLRDHVQGRESAPKWPLRTSNQIDSK